MKKLLFLSIIVLLVLPLLSFANTYKNLDTGKEFWVGSPNKFFPFFSVTQTECSALDGTTYTNYAGECRKRFNCKPSSDLSVCGCDITTCDSSSPPPTTSDPTLTTCSKSSGSLYVNGGKIASDGCYSGVLTRYECEPSSIPNGYSKSFSSTTYSVYTDGACSSGTTSGSVSYTSVPTSVVKGNKFTVQADIKLDAIAESDCLQTVEGCRLLFEIGAESCPSGNCFSQLKPQAIIPIFAERSACDDSPYWASTTTIVKSGDIVRATFTPLSPSLIGQYKYRVNVFRGCGDRQLPISSGQVSIEIKDGSSPPSETKYFCLSADKKTCTSRLGNCLSDETRFNDGATCEAQIGGGDTTGGDSGGDCLKEGQQGNFKECCSGLVKEYNQILSVNMYTCVDKTKSFSLTQDEYEQASSKAIAASACDFGSQCSKREGYDVKCITTDDTKSKNKKAFEEKGGICSLNKEDISLIGVIKIAGFILGGGYLCKSSSPPEGTCIATKIGEGFSWDKFVSSIGRGVNDAFGGKAKTHLEDTTMGYIVLLVIGIIILMIFTRR